MLDPYDDWLILMWPLVTLLAWMVIAIGLVHLLTDRSWERWADLPSPEMPLLRKFAGGKIDDDEHRRHGAKDPPCRLPEPYRSPRALSVIDPADRPRIRSPVGG